MRIQVERAAALSSYPGGFDSLKAGDPRCLTQPASRLVYSSFSALLPLPPQGYGQPLQPHPQPPFFLRWRSMSHTAGVRTAKRIKMSESFMIFPPYRRPKAMPIKRTSPAAIQAMPHCHSTTYSAHLRPISRLMAATAATQGV